MWSINGVLCFWWNVCRDVYGTSINDNKKKLMKKKEIDFKHTLDCVETEYSITKYCPHCKSKDFEFACHFNRIAKDNTIHSTVVYNCLKCKKDFHSTSIYIIK